MNFLASNVRVVILDSEVERLNEWRAELEGADDEFERIDIGLKDKLKLSPISSDYVDSLFGNGPVESVAANVGVQTFSGSNAGTHVVDDLTIWPQRKLLSRLQRKLPSLP